MPGVSLFTRFRDLAVVEAHCRKSNTTQNFKVEDLSS